MTDIEKLVAALQRIADYKWPDIIGTAPHVFHGAASGEEYKSTFPVPREQAHQALESVKAIAREALSDRIRTDLPPVHDPLGRRYDCEK